MNEKWDMSDWEQQIRGEILAARPAKGPSPNWEKMTGMLDLAAAHRRKRKWLLAACFGGLLLLGVGLYSIPQQELSRQYAVAMRHVTPELPAVQPTSPFVPPQAPLPQAAAPVSSNSAYSNNFTLSPTASDHSPRPLNPISSEVPGTEAPAPVDAQTPFMVAAIPDNPVYEQSLSSPMEASDVQQPIMRGPKSSRIQWELGLRGSVSDFAMSRTVSEDGIITTETGYGSQPGGWLELACVFPHGWEAAVLVGGQSVWHPVEPNYAGSANSFSDIWGRAFGGMLQTRKYFLRGKRVQPFLQAQTQLVRQQLTHTEFSLEALGIGTGSTDPHNVWKLRKNLPESAVITSTSISRSVLSAAAGVGLSLRINSYVGLYASTQASYQWIPNQPDILGTAAGEGLYLEHSLGLRVRI